MNHEQRQVIGMVTSYPGMFTNQSLTASQSDWLWHQTPHNFGQWGKIQMLANAEKPDFLLLYQFEFPRTIQKTWKGQLKDQVLNLVKPKIDPESRILAQFRGVAKERIISLLREPPLPEYQTVYQENYQKSKQYCGYVSAPDDLAPTPDYMPAIWYVGNSFRELNEMGPPGKVKPCSWITSGINRSENHQHRLNFLQKAQQAGLTFDLYGRNLPNWTNNYGVVNNKWHAIAPYYYNLAIENYAENQWYVSEKLWDALLAWCLPIYYGGPAADKLLPPGSFLRLPSLDEKGIAFIQEVTSSLDYWYEAQSAIAEARQIILHELNLLNWLSKYVDQSY
jgi:hypothetical protein